MYGKERLKGKYNPLYSRVEIQCDYCNKTFSIIKSKVNDRKHHFCSRECQHKWLIGKLKGKNNPNYNPNITDEEREKGRHIYGIENFRKEVYKRDEYKCKLCGDDKGGNLNAHHLNSYNSDKENRTNIDNGVCLCTKCHKLFHNIYGYGDNTKEQFKEFVERYINKEFEEVLQ